MKLYFSPASSFARKIRVMFLEKNAPHESLMTNVWESPDYQSVNPIGKVPALVLDDGRVIINSPLIADYVDGKFPTPRFIPTDPELRLEVRRREAIADGVMDAGAATLYENKFHDEAARSKAYLDRLRGKMDTGFKVLDGMLGSRPWMVGDAMTLADLAICCHIGFLSVRMPHLFPQERYPNLTRLWRTMEARDSMKKTVPPPA
ncbi:MAG: glutathione S-transferase family protein [Burkholderiales bacterium]